VKGQLNQIKELLTPELLMIKDNKDRTAAHLAAVNGHIDQIPKELLTPELLSIKDKYGKTFEDYLRK
jgi:hypothetical protein